MSYPSRSTALVTGGSSGIGAAVVSKLRAVGYDVIVLDLTAPLRELAPADDRSIGSLEHREGDVRDWEAVGEIIADIEESVPIDVLVNAAGIMRTASVEDVNRETWQQHIDVNLNGTLHTCRVVAAKMRHRGRGAIVNIASRLALVGQANYAAYSASKFGVVGLTQSLALEVAPYGVRVNAVCPGQIDNTGMRAIAEAASNSVEEHREQRMAVIPMRRFGQPSEVAELVEFLVSDRASYITGQAIAVCGGRSIA